MGNPANSFDFTVTLTTFLGTSISDGTYDDLLSTVKFDQIGQEAAATDIDAAAGQLWSNLSDDFVLATYPSFYLATKVWRQATIAALNTLGSDDDLAVDDIGYSETEHSMFYVVSVDGAGVSTWSAMGLTSGTATPDVAAVRISGAVALTEEISDTPGAASVNDYDPGGAWPDTNVIRVTPDAGDTTLTGLDATGAALGQLVVLCNVKGTDQVVLNHEDVASIAENRFLNTSNAALAIRPNGSVFLLYDVVSQRWRTV